MEGCENRGQDILFVNANGEPDIVPARIKRERMRGSIKTAAVELKTDHRKKPAAKLPLARIRENTALQNSRVARGHGGCFLHQGHEAFAKIVENRHEPRASHMLLIFIEERVIRITSPSKSS